MPTDGKDAGGKGGEGSLVRPGVLQEVFARVGDLSGLLVVAFVAPVAAGAGGISGRMSLLAEVNDKAKARDEQDARRLQPSQEKEQLPPPQNKAKRARGKPRGRRAGGPR